MNWLAPPRRFDPATPEFTDRAGLSADVLREELRVLETMNRRFGGYALPIRLVEELHASGPLRILDLGTGAADVPRAIVHWARRRGVRVEITAVDRNPAVLQCASEWCADWPEIRLEQQNAVDLPYPAESYDIVLCALLLHHLTADDATRLLRQMHAMTRRSYLVQDLRRNWPAIGMVELVARLAVRDPITRYDARASSRAAFTVEELRELAHAAGLTQFDITRRHGVFHMALVGRK